MREQRCLWDIQPGEKAVVRALLNQGGMRRRLLDLGLIENTEVECLGRSPGGRTVYCFYEQGWSGGDCVFNQNLTFAALPLPLLEA